MTNRVISRILTKYGVEFEQILAPQKGYRNTGYPIVLKSGEWANLILYKREPRILSKILGANRVSNYVAQHGLPARQTLSPKIIRLSVSERVIYGSLYNYLPGETIPWEAYTRRHIKLLGKTMSDLHAILANAGGLADTDIIAEYEAVLARMHRYFSDPPVQSAMKQKLNLLLPPQKLQRLRRLLEFSRELPDQQTLHMDFVRGNILFEGHGDTLEIPGILDFEKTAHGPKIFDIARTLAFLLVDCKYVPEEKVRKYFLNSGYEKYGMSSLHDAFEEIAFDLSRDRHPFRVQRSEHILVSGVGSRKGQRLFLQILEELVSLFLIHDFYKFLRHNPYEYLEQNEHFVRTRNLLLKRQRLQLSGQ
ncbi:Putative homoserine kinase type II (protein kinase fold)-like protein [candidate division TM7 genomosp. GTL1]|nr:Putative homoserine kinase type II (protein kinase fold)-like protein [candidate division TM7 genomosp. GTL1]